MRIQTTGFSRETPAPPWIKRLAWGVPLFFLLKGLLWLAIPGLYLLLAG